MARTAQRLAILLLTAAVGAAACESKPKTHPSSATTRPASAAADPADVCAVRLHDLCGAFLLHYAMRGRMPAELGELRETSPVLHDDALKCPGTNLAYTYDPQGIPILKSNLLVVVYDPVLNHGSTRWAIAIEEPHEGGALVTKVLRLPDSFFEAR
jgi:hypothetical protein